MDFPTDKVPLPFAIPKDLRSSILESYAAAIDEVAREELEYVERRLPRVIRRLRREPGSWLFDLATACEWLSNRLSDLGDEEWQLQSQEGREIVAALFYVCDPFDIIPDHDPQNGYLDDAMVINECLSRIEKAI